MMKRKHGKSEELKVKMWIHQISVLSPLLFVNIMKVLTSEARKGLPCELLCTDDLVLVADSMRMY